MNENNAFYEPENEEAFPIPENRRRFPANCLSLLNHNVNFKGILLVCIVAIILLLCMVIAQWSHICMLTQELQSHEEIIRDYNTSRKELIQEMESLKQNFTKEIDNCELEKVKFMQELKELQQKCTEAQQKTMIYQNQLTLIKSSEEQIENMRICYMTLDKYLQLKGKGEHLHSEYESVEMTRLAKYLPNCIMELSTESFIELKDPFQKLFKSNCEFKKSLEYLAITGNFEKMKAEQWHANNTIIIAKTCNFMCDLKQSKSRSAIERVLDIVTYYVNVFRSLLY